MIRCACYARVSTTDQHNENQIRELTAYAAARGWEIAGTYQDTMSGAKASRPGLNALMGEARKRKIDAVLVWKIDRFGRSVPHLANLICELDSLGVRFIATTQGIDTDHSNPSSRLLMNILASVAEFEREIIRERTNIGLKNARAAGKTLGRPKKVVDRQRIVEARASGMSDSAVAAKFGVSRAFVWREMERAKGVGA